MRPGPPRRPFCPGFEGPEPDFLPEAVRGNGITTAEGLTGNRSPWLEPPCSAPVALASSWGGGASGGSGRIFAASAPRIGTGVRGASPGRRPQRPQRDSNSVIRHPQCPQVIAMQLPAGRNMVTFDLGPYLNSPPHFSTTRESGSRGILRVVGVFLCVVYCFGWF